MVTNSCPIHGHPISREYKPWENHGVVVIFQYIQDAYKSIIQWNLSIADTLGTAESVLISEVSTFQGQFYTQLYIAGIHNRVLIKEVSLFLRVSLQRGSTVHDTTKQGCLQLLVLCSSKGQSILPPLPIPCQLLDIPTTYTGKASACYPVTHSCVIVGRLIQFANTT